MSVFDIARKIIAKNEGLRLVEYKDTTGHRTIGYGWNLDAKVFPVGMGMIVGGKFTINQYEADRALEISMQAHFDELVIALPWVVNLNLWRQAVLLDMAFNMGIPTLLKFVTTLTLIKSGHFSEAADRMLQSKWASQVKRRADINAQIMRQGFFPKSLMTSYGLNDTWESF
jgi:lysozyme